MGTCRRQVFQARTIHFIGCNESQVEAYVNLREPEPVIKKQNIFGRPPTTSAGLDQKILGQNIPLRELR